MVKNLSREQDKKKKQTSKDIVDPRKNTRFVRFLNDQTYPRLM